MTGRLQVLAVRVAVVAVLAVLAALAVVAMRFAVAVWLHFLWELALIVWEKWAESHEKYLKLIPQSCISWLKQPNDLK